MADFSIYFDDRGLSRAFNGEMQRRLPKGIASTLNKVAFKATANLKIAERAELHLTRNFIPASTQYEAARSGDGMRMASEMGILERVHFAGRLVDGGERTPFDHQYIAVPVEAKRGRRGGISAANKPSAILNKPGYFLQVINGVRGIWRRIPRSHSVKLMYVLKRRTDYTRAPYLHFDKSVEKTASEINYPQLLEQVVMDAMR